jgi:hypothetical protein
MSPHGEEAWHGSDTRRQFLRIEVVAGRAEFTGNNYAAILRHRFAFGGRESLEKTQDPLARAGAVTPERSWPEHGDAVLVKQPVEKL